MKQSTEEITREILQRAEQLDVSDAQRKNRLYTLLSVVASLLFIIGFAIIIPLFVSNELLLETAQHQTATIFASSQIGGYVLVGVIAFAVGAAVTLFCVKRFGRK